MKNDLDIQTQLESEIEQLEYKIENRKKYNSDKKFKYIMIKGVILLELAFPFTLGLCATSFAFKVFGKTPIEKTKIIDKPSIQYEIDSTGKENKLVSYNQKYDENLIEYSTSWILNDEGLFERQVTTYSYEGYEIKNDYDNILSLSKEEMSDIFKIVDLKKIQKTHLDKDDQKYQKDSIVIKQVIDDERFYRVRNETDFENFLELFIFLFLVYVEGVALDNLIGVILKKRISTKFKYMELENRLIREKDIEELRKILILKKENLKLLK